MNFISFDWEPMQFSLEKGYTLMQFPGVIPCPFLFIFVGASGQLFSARRTSSTFSSSLAVDAMLSGLVCVLLSGRRALFRNCH